MALIAEAPGAGHARRLAFGCPCLDSGPVFCQMVVSMDAQHELIDSPGALRRLCKQLRQAERIGLDTEFVGERTYTPRLELVQIAAAHGTAVIDCQAIESLGPLLDALLDPHIEKVLHAGQQDLELLGNLAGGVPGPVFDTQIAAAMVGYGAQTGYAALVERLLQVRINKTQTLTDWSRRPLTATQIAYAHEDVRYLLPVRERLGERVKRLGRERWLAEELERLQDASGARRAGVMESYLRVRGRGGLGGQGLAVLRELAAWREEEAQRRNKPRGSVLSDELLVDLARRAPDSEEALRMFRGQFARVVARHAAAILAAVQRALALPRKAWPQAAEARRLPAAPAGVIELLQATLRLCAEAAHIAPSMVATSADLQLLIEAHAVRQHEQLPILNGWRREIAGEQLLALLEGRATLRLDPATRRVRLEGRPLSTRDAADAADGPAQTGAKHGAKH